jgi:type IV fimbrial biogenesis protein FimT
MRKREQGFTAIEMMMVVATIGVVAALAFVSFQDVIKQKRLVSAAEGLYNEIKIAHSEAISNRSTFHVSFIPGANWCYGVDDNAACNCSVANSCQVDGVEYVVRSTEFPESSQAIAGLSNTGGISHIEIDGIRGVVTATGAITFTLNGQNMTVNVSKMGNPEICSSSNINGYGGC